MNIEIKKSIKPINYFDAISLLEKRLEDLHNNIETLKLSILTTKKNDIIRYKSKIKHHLLGNLITREFYEAGRIEHSLQDDPYIEEALRILDNKEEYHQILSP